MLEAAGGADGGSVHEAGRRNPEGARHACWTRTPGARTGVAKMASHAIFQYNVLAIDDTHNTWTNICVKMIIIRLICPRDEKIQNPEEIRSKGPRQR